LIFSGVLLLGAGARFVRRAGQGIRVGTALVSKMLCSGVFVSGLDPDALYREAVKPIPGQTRLAKRLNYNVDRATRQVTATWWGGFQSRAVYREGYGCVLVHGNGQKDALDGSDPGGVRATSAAAVLAALEVQPPPKLETTLDRAFAEPAQPPYRRVKAIVILHDGKLIAERYATGYNAETPILGYSLAKSVTNALIGILVRQKKLSVEQPAPVPEWQNPSDPRHAITIEQLMRMSSGLAIEESDSGFHPVRGCYSWNRIWRALRRART
jgi:Beta-lactamase